MRKRGRPFTFNHALIRSLYRRYGDPDRVAREVGCTRKTVERQIAADLSLPRLKSVEAGAIMLACAEAEAAMPPWVSEDLRGEFIDACMASDEIDAAAHVRGRMRALARAA